MKVKSSCDGIDDETIEEQTAQMIESFKTRQNEVEDAKIPNETDSHFYRRYLMANKWDVSEAKKQVDKTLHWRKTENISDLRKQAPSEILGCPETVLLEHLPMWYTAKSSDTGNEEVLRDFEGRPIFCYKVGQLNVKGLLECTKLDNFLRYVVWRLDRAAEITGSSDNVDKFVIVMDFDGLSLRRHLNKTTKAFISTLNTVGATYFPETLAKMFMINAPSVFASLWAIIRPLMDPKTLTKVSVLKKSKTDALLEHMNQTTFVQITDKK